MSSTFILRYILTYTKFLSYKILWGFFFFFFLVFKKSFSTPHHKENIPMNRI